MRDERVATAERTEVIGLLNRALEQGELAELDYDHRIAAIGGATYTSELVAQLHDLPSEFSWLPAAAVAPPRRQTGPGRAALILGVLSLPTSFCLLGGLLGLVAVALSLRGERPHGMSAALLGRVFGIIGVVLSLGAGVALFLAMTSSTSP